jgi:hypothetical protein
VASEVSLARPGGLGAVVSRSDQVFDGSAYVRAETGGALRCDEVSVRSGPLG